MSKVTCFERIDNAIALLNELKVIISDDSEDAPHAFLDAAHEAQEHINKAIEEALIPVLRQKSQLKNNTTTKTKNKTEAQRKLENIENGRPAKSGFHWSESDLAIVSSDYLSLTFDELCNKLERTNLAVAMKLIQLDLATKEELSAKGVVFVD